MYLIIDEVDGHIEEKNESNYLVFDPTEENQEVLEKYTDFWNGIKKGYGKTRVTSYKLWVTSYELRVRSWKLKSTSWNLKAWVEIQKCEFEWYPRVTSSNSRVQESLKTQWKLK